jgi:hypothetical protein
MKKKINRKFDYDEWSVPIDKLNTKLRQPDSLKLAQEIADASVVLVTERGRTISDVSGTDFTNRSGPLKRVAVSGVSNKCILVISSVFYPPDLLVEELRNRRQHEIVNVKLIYGYPPNSSECIQNWGEIYPDWTMDATISEKAKQIVDKLSDGSIEKDTPVIFSIVKKEHVKVLRKVLDSITDRQFIVLGLREPYLVDEDILARPNVTFITTGSGVEPSIKAIVKVLYGDLEPRPIGYISVSIGDEGERRADRESDIGAPIIPVMEKHPSIGEGVKQVIKWFFVGLGGLLSISLGTLARIFQWSDEKWTTEDERKEQRKRRVSQLWSSMIWGTVVFIFAIMAIPIVRVFWIGKYIEAIYEYQITVPCFLGFIGAFLRSGILKLAIKSSEKSDH